MSSKSPVQSESSFLEKMKAKLSRTGGCISRTSPVPERLKPTGAIVYLNIYDMMELNVYTAALGFGVYHSGVEVHGTEYCYGGHPMHYSGIFAMVPKDTESLGPNYTYKSTLELGRTDFTDSDVALILEDMGSQFCGDQYHLLHHNCNHFSNAFVQILCGGSIPKWVNRLASVGAKLPFVERSIPKMWLTPLPLEALDPPDQSSANCDTIHSSCPVLVTENLYNRRRSHKRSRREDIFNHSSSLVSCEPAINGNVSIPIPRTNSSSNRSSIGSYSKLLQACPLHSASSSSKPTSPIKDQPQLAQLLNGQFVFPCAAVVTAGSCRASSAYSSPDSNFTHNTDQLNRFFNGPAPSRQLSLDITPVIDPQLSPDRMQRTPSPPEVNENTYNCTGRFTSGVLSRLQNLCGITETHDSIIDAETELIRTDRNSSSMI